MVLLRPISALRFLSLAVTILLLTLLFLSKASGLPGFLVGVAAGLSIGLQTIVWNKQLHWNEAPGDR